MLKRLTVLLLALMMVLSLVACTSTAPGREPDAQQPAAGGEKILINYGVEAELSSMDTTVVTDGVSYCVEENTIEGLVRFDENSNVVPAIAETWDISEDGMTYTFHLRKDAKWSNGDPVTANDFVFAWKRLLDPNSGSENQYLIADSLGIVNASQIAYEGADMDTLGVSALDEQTLEVKLERPVPIFMSLMNYPPFFPINEAFFNAQGGMFGQSMEATLANGPFMITYWELGGTRVTIERNPYYYAKDEVTIDGVNFIVVKDPQSAVLAYENGDVDKVTITGELVERYKDSPDFSIVNGSFMWYLLVNHKIPELQNANLRLALAKCFNKQEICDGVLKDGSVPADYFVPKKLATGPDGKDFRDTAPTYLAYDKEAALDYWEAAKAELGTDAITLTLLIEDTESAIAVATYMQDAIQKNLPGITINLETVAKKVRLERNQNHEYEISLTRSGPDFPDPITYLDLFPCVTGRIAWDNPRYTELVDDASTGEAALDPAARWEVLKQIEGELLNEAHLIPIYQKNDAVLQKSNVTGIEEHMTIGNIFMHAQKTV